MAFVNVKCILHSSIKRVDAYKMLLLAARRSRPAAHGVCGILLASFVHNGRVLVRYVDHGRLYKVYIRMDDEESDFLSVLELTARDVYRFNAAFVPDLIVDGGGQHWNVYAKSGSSLSECKNYYLRTCTTQS